MAYGCVLCRQQAKYVISGTHMCIYTTCYNVLIGISHVNFSVVFSCDTTSSLSHVLLKLCCEGANMRMRTSTLYIIHTKALCYYFVSHMVLIADERENEIKDQYMASLSQWRDYLKGKLGLYYSQPKFEYVLLIANMLRSQKAQSPIGQRQG